MRGARARAGCASAARSGRAAAFVSPLRAHSRSLLRCNRSGAAAGASAATLRQRSARLAPVRTSSGSLDAAATPRAQSRNSSGSGRRTPDAALDVRVLLCKRYYAHICTQTLSSDASVFVFLLGILLAPTSSWRFAELALFFILMFLVGSHAVAALAFPLRNVLPARLRASSDATAIGRAVLMDWLVNTIATPIIFCAFMWRPDLRAANCPGASGLGECGLQYIVTLNLSRSFRPVVAQIPPRLAFAYEVVRAGQNVVCTLAAYALDRALGWTEVAWVFVYAGGALAFTLALISLHHDPLFADADFLPEWLDVLPPQWRPAREAVLGRLGALATRIAPMPLDYRVMSGLNVLGTPLAGVLQARHSSLATFGANGRTVLRVYFTLSISAVVSGFLSGGGAAKLGEMARRLGLDSEHALVEKVCQVVAQAPSEEDALRAAAATLHSRLFPRARGLALHIALGDDETPLATAIGAEDDSTALSGSNDDAADGETARSFVLAQDRCLIADSRDFPSGLATFSDWARCAAAGADVVVTAPLPAGPALLGTLVVSFTGAAPTQYEEALLRCCRAIGEGLFARRELATSNAMSALASDVFPKHVVQRLLERSRRASDCSLMSRSSFAHRRSQGSVAALDAPARGGSSNGGSPSPSPLPRDDSRSPSRAPSPAAELPWSSPDGNEEDEDAPRDPAAAMRRRRLSVRHSTPGAPDALDGSDLFYSEQHECVSIVFVDLCSFTPLAESQDSLVTMQMLHAVFSRFDDLAQSLGVYKMESVGDCYMAAAGLLSPTAAGSARRHAAAATLFALRVHAAAGACGLHVRAGVHSGPCSSGLVGRLRARFCLFGDTVNTASRLESQGVPGCVQLSRSTWRLAGLPDALSPEERRVQLKGKAGALDACLLDAGSPEAEQADAVLEAQLKLYDDENTDALGAELDAA